MDVITLLAAVLVNALLMGLALMVGVGLRLRSGLQAWQYALLSQAGGFALFILAAFSGVRPLASLGVVLLSVAASLTVLAVCRFLHRKASHRWLWSIPPLLGLAHAAAYARPEYGIVLSNIVLGLQMLWAAMLVLGGAGGERWRWLCGLAGAANGVMTIVRAGILLLFPGQYPEFSAPHPLNIAGMLLLNASLVLGTIGFLLAHRDEAERALVRLASLDPLTGLLNRREWFARAVHALAPAGERAVLMMLDLDHFKRVNDERGHPVGDEVLKLAGEVLRGELRASDLVGRYGGEEFCLLLLHCEPEAFGRLDARLHQALRRRCEASLGFEADFSAGAVRVMPGETLAAAIQRADDQLYRAKHAGRGCTQCADGVL